MSPPAPSRLLILGAGGHARVVAEILCRQYPAASIQHLDDAKTGRTADGHPIAGGIGDLERHLKSGEPARVIVGIGDNWVRAAVAATVRPLLQRHGSDFVSALDPAAVVSRSAVIGAGTVVMPGAVVNAGCRIGDHAILNTACSVDHDGWVGDFAHISPGAHLAGGVRVEGGAQVGTGASVIPGVRIGEWTIVGAGSAVVRDLPGGVVAMGVPASVRRRL